MSACVICSFLFCKGLTAKDNSEVHPYLRVGAKRKTEMILDY